jgi:DNA repair protein RadC
MQKQVIKSVRPKEHIRVINTKKGLKPRLINRGINKPSKIIKKFDKINNATEAVKLIRGFKIDKTRENLIVIYLDTQNKPIGVENVFTGGLDSCLIDPKTLFRKALFRNASKIIILHNHPSGNMEPSSCDKKIYKTLKKGGEILQLQIVDSIIINGNKAYSLESEEMVYA